MILEDAVDQRMIEVSPVRRKRRRGRRRDHAPSRLEKRLEKVWALPEEVIRIAVQAGMLGGAVARLLAIMTAWTGCRWGAMAGLQRDRVDLRRGVITIDPEVGCLHESAHGLWLGPPKTPSSARTVQLPPFLTDLLRKHLAQHPHQFVFTAPQGGWLRRSDFNRRVFRPAVDGDLKRGLYPVKPGLCFHGLRHSHKTWLVTDHIPQIASTKRMGHHLSDKLEEVYTHVAMSVSRESGPSEVTTAVPRVRGAGEGRTVLQDYSSTASERDQGSERVSIIARMKKALRPARCLRSKSFDREWS
jgi:integrase